MKLVGHVFAVTHFVSFVKQYIADDSSPDPNCIQPAGGVRLTLFRKTRSLLPPLAETVTDTTGAYELDFPTRGSERLFLVASDCDDEAAPSGKEEPTTGCWYRSADCDPQKLDGQPRNIYVAHTSIPGTLGFSQTDLATLLSKTKRERPDIEQIAGRITAQGIDLTCSGKGAKASGRLVLSPDRSGDLTKILRHSVEKFHLDLPGPSWLVGLLVSREAIEASILTGLYDLATEINEKLHLLAITRFKEEAGIGDSALAAKLADQTSLSLRRLSYAQASGNIAPNDSRTIAGEACLGFPKHLLPK